MKRLSKIIKIMIWTIVIIILFIVFCIWQNNSIVVTSSDYYSSKLPADFNNFKIVQISDLHNKMFGEYQSKLLSQVENAQNEIF